MSGRLYEPVWKRLKDSESVNLKVCPALLKRVKRGISKEKDEDLSFKVFNTDDRWRLIMDYCAETQILSVSLEGQTGLFERQDRNPEELL